MSSPAIQTVNQVKFRVVRAAKDWEEALALVRRAATAPGYEWPAPRGGRAHGCRHCRRSAPRSTPGASRSERRRASRPRRATRGQSRTVRTAIARTLRPLIFCWIWRDSRRAGVRARDLTLGRLGCTTKPLKARDYKRSPRIKGCTGQPCSCVDGPRRARGHVARGAGVACSHVSGLLMQSGRTAGPDGFRASRPHHSNGIAVPMKRQAALDCVGSTDCAITLSCPLASSARRRFMPPRT